MRNVECEAAVSWRVRVAEDLELLAHLHGVELGADALEALELAGFPGCLALPEGSEPGAEARGLMQWVIEGRDPQSRMSFDELAVDYAAIYLTGRYHASPNESAWLDEDGLERQAPMFAVREWYRKYGMVAGNWRTRQDDNLTLQLQFVAYLFEAANDDQDLKPAARFLDEHALLWIDRFAKSVGARATTPFYAALAMITADYLQTLRMALVMLADEPLPPPPVAKEVRAAQQMAACGVGEPMVFVPGAGPTW